MDRIIVYPGAIPLDSDLLNAERFAMIALGYALSAPFGPNATFVSNLACNPTTPTPSLSVVVGPGSIVQPRPVDTTAYGSLPADNSDTILKQGINIASTIFAITPPVTAGYSQNYLIEAQFLESDALPIVLPYYNSNNPAVPYSGPANAGTSQNTVRQQRVSLQLKAGTSFPTGGMQTIPSTDNGWLPLYIISVNNGQTQITSANIAQAPGAPFIGSLLTQSLIRLSGPLQLYVSNFGSDTNNGLLPTTAFATITAAYSSLVNNYNLAGQSVTINVAAGTYTNTAVGGSPAGFGGGSVITISGAGSASTFLTTSGVSSCLVVSSGATISIRNFNVSGYFGLTVYQGCFVNMLDGLSFGACTNVQIFANGGSITYTASYSVSGSATIHWSTIINGSITNISASAVTVAITGTPTFSVAFASARSGQISIWNNAGVTAFSGSATGTRYICSCNGGIDTNTGNISLLPGNAAGITGSGTNTGFYA